jgi:hypothetical protein
VAEPLDEQELQRRLEEELRRLKVSDVLVQTLLTLSSLGFRRLQPDERELDEARLAIDALRVLVPVLAETVGADMTRDFNQMVANLQLAYAAAARDATAEPAPAEPPAGDEEPPPDEERPSEGTADSSR